MAAYINAEYCYERLSESLTLALTRSGIEIDSVIESATALVQHAVSAHGFTPPNTDATTTDAFLQSATFACVWQALADYPKASLKLPDNWGRNPHNLAYLSIEDGSANHRLAALGLSVNTSISAGGSQWSDRSSTSDDPKRATRDELAGY